MIKNKKFKDYELKDWIKFIELTLLLITTILNIVTLIISIKRDRDEKRALKAEDDYYDDYDFTLSEIGDIDDDYLDEGELKF